MENPDKAQILRSIVRAFGKRRFAVIDGAHFEDLPAVLKQESLFARSLFLDKADVEVQKAGPWLVSLDQLENALERVIALVSKKPAVVYWCCDVSENIIWRHLRTLSMVDIPRWAAEGFEEPIEPRPDDTHETVFFRHYDPTVLGAIMPVLDAAQFSRILGPAIQIAFESEEYGGPKRVIYDRNLPKAPSGNLMISSAQIRQLSQRRLEVTHRRNMSYLRDVAEQYVGSESDEALYRHVLISYSTGRDLGLKSEAAHARWSLLMVLTKGRILQHNQSLEFIKQLDQNPDDKVKELITITVDSLRSGPPTGGAKS